MHTYSAKLGWLASISQYGVSGKISMVKNNNVGGITDSNAVYFHDKKCAISHSSNIPNAKNKPGMIIKLLLIFGCTVSAI